MRVVPEAGVVLVLLTNGGGARRLYAELFGELLRDPAGVRMPGACGPLAAPSAVDVAPLVGTYNAPLVGTCNAPLVGTYKREGGLITVSEEDGKGYLVYEFVDGMKDFSPPLEMDLVPVGRNVFAGPGSSAYGAGWMPVVFATLADGTRCVYIGVRAARKAA